MTSLASGPSAVASVATRMLPRTIKTVSRRTTPFHIRMNKITSEWGYMPAKKIDPCGAIGTVPGGPGAGAGATGGGGGGRIGGAIGGTGQGPLSQLVIGYPAAGGVAPPSNQLCHRRGRLCGLVGVPWRGRLVRRPSAHDTYPFHPSHERGSPGGGSHSSSPLRSPIHQRTLGPASNPAAPSRVPAPPGCEYT
jgi:hypothetical protein